MEDRDYLREILDKDCPLTLGTESSLDDGEEVNTNSTKFTLTDINKMEQSFINTFDIETSIPVEGSNRPSIISIPVTIYPRIVYTDSDSLVESMLADSVDNSIFDRLESYKAGLINLSDLIFATDLIKKYKNKRLKKPNDVTKFIKGIQLTTTIHDVYNNTRSFAKNYNIYILTEEDKQHIEKILKGNVLTSKKQKLLDAMYAFSINFVETNKERYTRIVDSLEGFSTLSFTQVAKKNDKVDMNEIVKAMMLNKQPF